MDNKKIIKIQRSFRIYKLNKLFIQFEKNNMNKNICSFDEYSKKLLNKNIISNVTNIINALNKLCNSNITISPKIILTGFLIKNYTDDIIGNIKDRHPIDIHIIDWSKKLVQEFKSEKEFHEYKLLITYIENYHELFKTWKNIDKNRTIQNIIISYGNRRDHLEYINDEEMNMDSKNKVVNELNKECRHFILSLLKIDPYFDIEYLKSNYKNIIADIYENMSKIYEDITLNFQKAYLDILIDEFRNDNKNIILNFINETNDRILLLTPKEYNTSVKNKLSSYNYKKLLIENKLNYFNDYFYFIMDTVMLYSSPEDDNENAEWKNSIENWLNSVPDLYYHEVIPLLLIEINVKIDKIINKINNLFKYHIIYIKILYDT